MDEWRVLPAADDLETAACCGPLLDAPPLDAAALGALELAVAVGPLAPVAVAPALAPAPAPALGPEVGRGEVLAGMPLAAGLASPDLAVAEEPAAVDEADFGLAN